MKDRSYGVVPISVGENGEIHFLLVWEPWGDGHWCFPKGHSLDGESPGFTALRKFEEETGISKGNWIGQETIIQEYSFENDGRTINRWIQYYLGGINKDEVQIEDTQKVRWMTLDELIEASPFTEIHETARQAIELAI